MAAFSLKHPKIITHYIPFMGNYVSRVVIYCITTNYNSHTKHLIIDAISSKKLKNNTLLQFHPF